MASAAAIAAPLSTPMSRATLGTLANTLLGRPGYSAHVIAAGRSATYLRDEAGEILWLAPPTGVRHRRAILVDAEIPVLQVGCVASVVEQRLIVDRVAVCNMEHAAVWCASPVPVRPAAAGDLHADRVRVAAQLARAHAHGAPLLEAICGFWLGEEPAVEIATEFDPFAARALPALVATAHALSGDPAAPIAGLVDQLIGLGPGLTPSGDDVLGGLLFALACLGRDCSDLIGSGDRRTHPISLAIVRDLAQGHGPEPLHRLAHELLDPRSAEPSPAAIAEVAAIGHWSGRDLLAGFLAGLCAARARWAIGHRSHARSRAWLRI